MELFNFNNIYSCYILGFLWGDGFVDKNYAKNADKIPFNGMRIEITTEDYLDFQKVLDKTNIKHTTNHRTRPNRKPQTRISFNDRSICDLIIKYNFPKKSLVSPNFLLAEIPKHNHLYWFRGFFDADGHVGKTKKNVCCLSGSYNQDWSFCENKIKELGGNYSIYKSIDKKNNKSSKIHIKSPQMIFLDYIYSKELFGLQRKYDRYIEIKKLIKPQ